MYNFENDIFVFVYAWHYSFCNMFNLLSKGWSLKH